MTRLAIAEAPSRLSRMTTSLLDDVSSYRPMTAEDVLAWFIEDHRHQCQYDDAADPLARLAFETTVARWREACDLVPCRPLGRALNARFQTSFADSDWRSALEPAKVRTLRGVCELVASQAMAPSVEPLRLMGRDCRPAAYFLAVRDALRRSGADVSAIRPSSELNDHLRKHVWPVLDFCAKVAPGRLPPVHTAKPAYDVCIGTFSASLVAMLIVRLIGENISACANLLLAPCAAIAYVGSWIVAKLPPKHVRFGELRTFRDLSYALCRPRETEAGPDGSGLAGRSM